MEDKDILSWVLRAGYSAGPFEAIQNLHFKIPTPIQLKSIPVALEGNDLIGIAQTGTGKTLAFGVPMIQRLMQMQSGLPAQAGQGLVVLPTRELAMQVEEMLGKLGGKLGLKMAVVIGGASMFAQRKALERNPHIIIATPGRIIDHIENSRLRLDKVKILILDEADRMMDMGFTPQLKKILFAVPKERQTMLFSATMPDEIARIAANFMKLPVRLEIAPSGTTPKDLAQEVFFIQPALKGRLLEKDFEGLSRTDINIYAHQAWREKNKSVRSGHRPEIRRNPFRPDARPAQTGFGWLQKRRVPDIGRDGYRRARHRRAGD